MAGRGKRRKGSEHAPLGFVVGEQCDGVVQVRDEVLVQLERFFVGCKRRGERERVGITLPHRVKGSRTCAGVVEVVEAGQGHGEVRVRLQRGAGGGERFR